MPTEYGDQVDVVPVHLEATFDLRSVVLGWAAQPIRIDDDAATHLALVDEDIIVAVLSHASWPCPDRPGIPARYFWAMAVDSTRQRRGYGRRLLRSLMAHARAAEERLVWADARESAVGFYIACGATASALTSFDEITGLVDRRVTFTIQSSIDRASSPGSHRPASRQIRLAVTVVATSDMGDRIGANRVRPHGSRSTEPGLLVRCSPATVARR